jgi:hypothetical protein
LYLDLKQEVAQNGDDLLLFRYHVLFLFDTRRILNGSLNPRNADI